MIELFGFLAIFVGAPPLVASFAAVVLRRLRREWSTSRKARIAALIGPAPQAFFAIYLVVVTNLTECQTDEVCDSPVGMIGLMILILAAVSYPLTAIIAYKIVQRPDDRPPSALGDRS